MTNSCPQCGTWVDQLETRNWLKGIYRRYACANMHTFSTINGEPYTRPDNRARNAEIIRLAAHGEKKTHIALMLGVAVRTVYYVLSE